MLQVLVASVGEGMLEKRMQVCAQLWRLGVAAEFGYKEAPKFPQQLREANDHAIPLMVLFGKDELQRGMAKVCSAAVWVCSGCCSAEGSCSGRCTGRAGLLGIVWHESKWQDAAGYWECSRCYQLDAVGVS